VIYALQDAGQYRGKLSGADLHFPSPYNTYAHPGLPPGPIGNPGEASLRAALDPAKTDYLYFVANTQGGHFFAASLVETNRNVTKYRRLLAGLPAESPDPSPDPAPALAPAPVKHTAKVTGEARECGQAISRQAQSFCQTKKGLRPMNDMVGTKKALILQAARAIGAQKFTPAVNRARSAVA